MQINIRISTDRPGHEKPKTENRTEKTENQSRTEPKPRSSVPFRFLVLRNRSARFGFGFYSSYPRNRIFSPRRIIWPKAHPTKTLNPLPAQPPTQASTHPGPHGLTPTPPPQPPPPHHSTDTTTPTRGGADPPTRYPDPATPKGKATRRRPPSPARALGGTAPARRPSVDPQQVPDRHVVPAHS